MLFSFVAPTLLVRMDAHVLSCFRMIWCLSLIEDWPCVLLIFLWCNLMSQFTQAERNRNYYNSTLESDLNLWPNVGCIAEELAVTIFKHLEIEDFLLTLLYLLMNAIDSEDVFFLVYLRKSLRVSLSEMYEYIIYTRIILMTMRLHSRGCKIR